MNLCICYFSIMSSMSGNKVGVEASTPKTKHFTLEALTLAYQR